MKKILVAVDFSECSFNALEHAITIANKADAGVEMMFVIKPDTSREMFTEGPQTLSSMVKDKFDEMLEKYQPMMGSNKLTYLIREGKVYHEIVKEADRKEIFLVMAGTHGCIRIRRVLDGQQRQSYRQRIEKACNYYQGRRKC